MIALPRRIDLVVNVSASHAVGHRFVSQPGHTKDHHKNGTNCLPVWHACIRVYEFDSAARLYKRPCSVCNYLRRHAHKRSPGINRKRRVMYPGPGFLSSAS